jgi:ppGpp synthetase/RelA/SpoT-type nucleotidyltranferase
MQMTKSQINKLGDKLRTAFELDTDTLARLQHFRASYDEPMLKAQTLIKDEVGLESTSRLKTTNTIIEKLQREKTRLAEMQDIGGLRIVSEVDLTAQDEIVRRIVDKFPVTKVIDRRSNPTHGYRAVHVIATLDERSIEIQVRTQLQDLWAQAMERLADEVGREIRYGGAPRTHGEDVESLLNISNDIAQSEAMLTELNQMETELPQPQRAASKQRELRLHIARIQRVRSHLRRREGTIRATLEAIISRGGASK